MKTLILSTILTIGTTGVQAQEILPKIERPIKKKGPSRTKKYLLIGGAALADLVMTRITVGGGMASEANPIAGDGFFGQAAVTVVGTVLMTETALYLEKNDKILGKGFTWLIVGAKGYACYTHYRILWRRKWRTYRTPYYPPIFNRLPENDNTSASTGPTSPLP